MLHIDSSQGRARTLTGKQTRSRQATNIRCQCFVSAGTFHVLTICLFLPLFFVLRFWLHVGPQDIAACAQSRIISYWTWASLTCWCPRWTVSSTLYSCWIRIGHLARFIAPSIISWPTLRYRHRSLHWSPSPSIGEITSFEFLQRLD